MNRQEIDQCTKQIEDNVAGLLEPFGFKVSRSRDNPRVFQFDLPARTPTGPRYQLRREVSEHILDHAWPEAMRWLPDAWAKECLYEVMRIAREHADAQAAIATGV